MEQQSEGATAAEVVNYFGDLEQFSDNLLHLSTLLSTDKNTLALCVDLDKTTHFSPIELNEGINQIALTLQQEEVMTRFGQWLAGLTIFLRRRLLFIINTSRVVTTDPKDFGKKGYLYLPEGRWPSERLSGLPTPDMLISRNGQEFRFFDSPVFRSRLPELVDRVKSYWPPESSVFTDADRERFPRLLNGSHGFSPKSIQAFDQCENLSVLEEMAIKCKVHMRRYPSSKTACSHVHMYDVRINKGTGLYRLLNQIQLMQLFNGDLHFVTAGDDFPELPMLFPKEYISSLPGEELMATFADASAPEIVGVCHAGSILSSEASSEMKDAIKTIRDKEKLFRAHLPGLPGILQKTREILEQRLNIYAL